jgi:uncharacterized repeat protein (TIGR01451 family)
MRQRLKTSTPLLAVAIFASMMGGYVAYGAVANSFAPAALPCYPADQYPCNQVADLSLVKDVDRTSATVGQTIVYTINVTNNGPTGAHNVVVTDALPSRVSFVDAAASDGGTCSYDSGNHRVTCVWGNVGPTGTRTVTIGTQAASSGTAVNFARVDSYADDPDSSNDLDSATTSINSPGGGGAPACSDNVDNDGDGKIDFDGGDPPDPSKKDPGCVDAADSTESPDPTPTPTPTPTATTTPTPTPTPTPTQTPEDQVFPTKITIFYSDGEFFGEVKSPAAECRQSRALKLRKKLKNHRRRTLGSMTSGADASWSFPKNANKGRFFATARRAAFPQSDGSTITCLRGRSRTLKLQ